MTPTEFKEARKSLGLNQSEMAAMLGYGASARISEIENGKMEPSETVLRLLRAYLDGYRPRDWPAEQATQNGR